MRQYYVVFSEEYQNQTYETLIDLDGKPILKSMMTTLEFRPQGGGQPSCHAMLRPPILPLPSLAATAETVTRAPSLRPAPLPLTGKKLSPDPRAVPGPGATSTGNYNSALFPGSQ